MNTSPCDAVRRAILEYEPSEGYELAPKSKLATSPIYKWGVRVQQTIEGQLQFSWVCLGSNICRANNTAIRLSHGKTSRATSHLKKAHGLVSPKTVVTETTRQHREQTIQRYTTSPLYRQNPARFVVLLETMRIVLNNLPYRSVEYEESVLLRELCYTKELRATLNAKVVDRTIYELYMSAKSEIMSVIAAARMPFPSFTLVTDFWTSKAQSAKYIGIRLYMVDQQYKFRSILLGTRAFNPQFYERDGGVRLPFRKWITRILDDFGSKPTELMGSTSDGGADVEWMMKEGFGLQWEWCLAHLSNAATKMACGLVDDSKKSKNPAMTKLLSKIVKTVYQTRHVEVMGTLFEELCKMLSTDNSTQLLDYRSHRFLGLTRVVGRIIAKWGALTEWYAARQARAVQNRLEPPPFPLEGRESELHQLMSLLKPISVVNSTSQAETPTQVDVLLSMFILRLQTLNCAEPLRHHQSTLNEPVYISVDELTPMIRFTREMLGATFHNNYFKRYTDSATMQQCSYVFEMQLALHPDYKTLEASLRPIILLCSEQHPPTPRRPRPEEDEEQKEDPPQEPTAAEIGSFNVVTVVALVKERLRRQLKKAYPKPAAPQARPHNENLRLFGRHNGANQEPENRALRNNTIHEGMVLWFNDQTALREEDGKCETVLEYWNRQCQIGRYRLLPLVARALFSVPTSSAQLERDFRVSGLHVTPMRARIGTRNVDMCVFINRNRAYVDITQCNALEGERVDMDMQYDPMRFDPMEDIDGNFDDLPIALFSNGDF